MTFQKARSAPGPGIPLGSVTPYISILGGIPTSKIDNFNGLTTSAAVFALNGLAPDYLGRPCPFAGRVVLQGPQFVGYKYRVRVRNLTVSGPWMNVVAPISVTDLFGNLNPHAPHPNGLFDFLPFTQNIANVLAWWDTARDDLWEVQLQIFDASDNLLSASASHRIKLDNTPPDAGIHLATGAGDCGKFGVGTTLTGRVEARDAYFRCRPL